MSLNARKQLLTAALGLGLLVGTISFSGCNEDTHEPVEKKTLNNSGRILEPEQNVVFCDMNNPMDIANAIGELHNIHLTNSLEYSEVVEINYIEDTIDLFRNLNESIIEEVYSINNCFALQGDKLFWTPEDSKLFVDLYIDGYSCSEWFFDHKMSSVLNYEGFTSDFNRDFAKMKVFLRNVDTIITRSNNVLSDFTALIEDLKTYAEENESVALLYTATIAERSFELHKNRFIDEGYDRSDPVAYWVIPAWATADIIGAAYGALSVVGMDIIQGNETDYKEVGGQALIGAVIGSTAGAFIPTTIKIGKIK